jgi:Protein of unknown function (DUF3800)
MDESGNTGTRLDDPDQPIHYLAAVGVEECHLNPLEMAFKKILSAHLPVATKEKYFELKGQTLRKGAGFFKPLKPIQRIELATQLLNLLPLYQVKIFYGGIDKRRDAFQEHPHEMAFMLLVSGVEAWLRRQNPPVLGLLIADEQEEMEQILIDSIHWSKGLDRVEGEQFSTQIVDSIHFVRSSNNALIQLADLVAFIVNRGLRELDLSKPANQIDKRLFDLLLPSVVHGLVI